MFEYTVTRKLKLLELLAIVDLPKVDLQRVFYHFQQNSHWLSLEQIVHWCGYPLKQP